MEKEQRKITPFEALQEVNDALKYLELLTSDIITQLKKARNEENNK